eukprot:6203089-Pleurochrysis_carterae.AAC.1
MQLRRYRIGLIAACVQFLAVAVDDEKQPHLGPVSAVSMLPLHQGIALWARGCLHGLALLRSISGMREVIARFQTRVKVSVEPCRSNVGNEANQKLMKVKQAHSGVVIKLSP